MAGQSMASIERLRAYGIDGNAVIVQEYTPGRGWQTQTMRKRASRAWLCKLRAKGVTHVAVEVAPGDRGRLADFAVRELA